MNRYILAALYVVAGCAVTIPLKAPESGALLRVDRCRPAITNTLKVVSVCFEENETAHDLLTGLFSEGGVSRIWRVRNTILEIVA